MTNSDERLLDEPRTAEEIAIEARQHRRTRICVWIILIGLANFILYNVLYAYFNGEAVNGKIELVAGRTHYYLQSDTEVSRAVFIYSGIHSISIWPTVGAIMLAMLTLAKERIASSMRKTIIRGQTVITIFATIITLIIVVMTIWFTLQFVKRLNHPIELLPNTQASYRARHGVDG